MVRSNSPSIAPQPDLRAVQADWDNAAAALVVRRYRVIPARLPPAPREGALEQALLALACAGVLVAGTLAMPILSALLGGAA